MTATWITGDALQRIAELGAEAGALHARDQGDGFRAMVADQVRHADDPEAYMAGVAGGFMSRDADGFAHLGDTIAAAWYGGFVVGVVKVALDD